jgi:hypothetical protein
MIPCIYQGRKKKVAIQEASNGGQTNKKNPINLHKQEIEMKWENRTEKHKNQIERSGIC